MQKQEAILLGIPYAALRHGAVAADLVACLADRVGVKDAEFVVMIQRDAVTASLPSFLRRGDSSATIWNASAGTAVLPRHAAARKYHLVQRDDRDVRRPP